MAEVNAAGDSQQAVRNCFLVLIGFLFLSACSGLVARISQQPAETRVSPEAREFLLLMHNQNLKLNTFKGTGRIKFLENGQNSLSVRAAWVASMPAKLRIALRSVTGQPAASFASDGKWLYFFSHTDRRFYKKRASTDFLRKFFSIPLKPDDVANILAGRVPVRKYYYAAVERNASAFGYILVLHTKWHNVCEKIYFTENKKAVQKIEMFDGSGAYVYGVKFCGMQIINGYQVPTGLLFSDAKGAGFQLDIDRYWTDVAVSPSVFVLSPPG